MKRTRGATRLVRAGTAPKRLPGADAAQAGAEPPGATTAAISAAQARRRRRHPRVWQSRAWAWGAAPPSPSSFPDAEQRPHGRIVPGEWMLLWCQGHGRESFVEAAGEVSFQ